jgi:hypothetical protein
MKTMIRKKIYLLLLLMPLLHGCKESDFNDLLDRQGDQRKELQELTDLCKKLNEDIYNLQVIVNTDRIGDNITHIEELADGAGYTISFSKSAPITIRNGKKGDTGPDGDAGNNKSNHTKCFFIYTALIVRHSNKILYIKKMKELVFYCLSSIF